MTKLPKEDLAYAFTNSDFYRSPDARPEIATVQKEIDERRRARRVPQAASLIAPEYVDLSLIEEAKKRIDGNILWVHHEDTKNTEDEDEPKPVIPRRPVSTLPTLAPRMSGSRPAPGLRVSLCPQCLRGWPMNGAAQIAIERVSHVYRPPRGRPVLALDDVSLAVGDREFVALLGPSGCGKSTLLYLIGGFLPVEQGAIRSTPAVAGPGPDRGIVFQHFALFPWKTVLQNVLYGLEKQGLPRDATVSSPIPCNDPRPAGGGVPSLMPKTRST